MTEGECSEHERSRMSYLVMSERREEGNGGRGGGEVGEKEKEKRG